MRFFAILPAAGVSRRMGEPKLLLPWGQETIVERVVSQWQASGVDRIVVVIRSGDDALRSVLGRTAATIVSPPTDPPDMKASVICGLRFLREKERPVSDDQWLLAPADMPLLRADTIRIMLEARRSRPYRGEPAGSPEILVPVFGTKRGHPVLFPWALAGRVERLEADEGINVLIRNAPVREVPVSTSDVLLDVDTREEYVSQRTIG